MRVSLRGSLAAVAQFFVHKHPNKRCLEISPPPQWSESVYYKITFPNRSSKFTPSFPYQFSGITLIILLSSCVACIGILSSLQDAKRKLCVLTFW